MVRLLRFVNALSIDVALGAMVSALFFARIISVEVDPLSVFCLGLTVWLIYTVDHLADARSIAGEEISFRHRLHRDNFRVLGLAVIIGSLALALAALFLPTKIVIQGTILGLFLPVYIILNRLFRFLKEILIGVVYTFGVLLPAFSVNDGPVDVQSCVIIFAFFLIAFVNLLIFAFYDVNLDKRQGFNSLPASIGLKMTRIFLWSLFSILAIVIGYVGLAGLKAALILAIMTLIHVVLIGFQQRFKKNDAYRIIGDAAFFVTGLILV